INELMSVNQKTVIDSTDLKYEDWTELYNNSAQDISLEGYYLSDDSANPLKWEFPTGTSIHSKGLLAVWLDEDGNAPGLHANFKLSSSGEMLLLSREDGLVLDSITFGSLSADHSLERCPNGTGSFALTSKPSFLKINCSLTSVDEQEISCRLYPNPASNDVIIDFEKGQPVLAEFIDIQGKMVKREVIAHSGQMIELSGMAQGYYHVRLIDTNGLSLGVLKLIIH
ncbi:MAG TPA: lamin tail domain-containing protein, partial [Saprospiraceae bacterium]|nr:lamin tail domain-containing protein [Saprospiraceae bacterium]